MIKVIEQTYNITQEYGRKITLILLAACGFLAIFYALNVYMIISRTVSLESINEHMATLTASVDNLDAQYLQISGKIGPDALASRGLTQGSVSLFVSRTVSLGSLASRGHEL